MMTMTDTICALCGDPIVIVEYLQLSFLDDGATAPLVPNTVITYAECACRVQLMSVGPSP